MTSSHDTLQAEFLQLLEQCHGLIMQICYAYTSRQFDDVRDLYQDIAVNLWLGFPRFRHESKPSTWVYTIALNTARMYRRSLIRRPQFVEIDDSLLQIPDDHDLSDKLDSLYQLIDRLKPNEQDLIMLYIDGMKQAEIAQLYNTTEDAINHKIKRIKQKLIKLNHEQQ